MKRLVPVLLLAAVAGATLPAAQVIDRILAVVGTSPVTQSDVYAAMTLRLETPPAGAADPVAAVLDRLIERRLTLAEVERYAPPAPSEQDVSLRLERLRLSFPSEAAFQKALADSGMDDEQLRRYLRDDLRVAAYLQQRFGGSLQPSEEQILEYYTAHPEQFTRGGVRRPFDQAHDDARAAYIADRRAVVIRDWVAGLRRRANVSVLYAGR